MTSSIIKNLIAGAAAVALVGTAVAQGTTANPAVKNPATGAGQQSSQNTPMGTTGTPGGSGTAGSMSGSSTTAPMNSGSTSGTMSSGSTNSGSMSSGSTSGSSMGSTSAGSGTDMGTRTTRRARADRN